MTATLEGGEWSEARPGRTLPTGKIRYPFYRKLGGPQGRSGRAENLVPTGIRSRTVQPVVSRYTDWATRPTHNKWIKFGDIRGYNGSDYVYCCLLGFFRRFGKHHNASTFRDRKAVTSVSDLLTKFPSQRFTQEPLKKMTHERNLHILTSSVLNTDIWFTGANRKMRRAITAEKKNWTLKWAMNTQISCKCLRLNQRESSPYKRPRRPREGVEV